MEEEVKTEAKTPEGTKVPASNVAPGTENAPHTGLIEPHSPAANALPNAGASGVSHEQVAGAAVQSTIAPYSSAEPNVLETNIPITAERISVDENAQLPKTQHPNDVKFKVNYPSDWKGEKSMPQGSVQVVSKESAEYFQSLKIGKIIK